MLNTVVKCKPQSRTQSCLFARVNGIDCSVLGLVFRYSRPYTYSIASVQCYGRSGTVHQNKNYKTEVKTSPEGQITVKDLVVRR